MTPAQKGNLLLVSSGNILLLLWHFAVTMGAVVTDRVLYLTTLSFVYEKRRRE